VPDCSLSCSPVFSGSPDDSWDGEIELFRRAKMTSDDDLGRPISSFPRFPRRNLKGIASPMARHPSKRRVSLSIPKATVTGGRPESRVHEFIVASAQKSNPGSHSQSFPDQRPKLLSTILARGYLLSGILTEFDALGWGRAPIRRASDSARLEIGWEGGGRIFND